MLFHHRHKMAMPTRVTAVDVVDGGEEEAAVEVAAVAVAGSIPASKLIAANFQNLYFSGIIFTWQTDFVNSHW